MVRRSRLGSFLALVLVIAACHAATTAGDAVRAGATSAAPPGTTASVPVPGSPSASATSAVPQVAAADPPPRAMTLSADPKAAGTALATAFAGSSASRGSALVAAFTRAELPLSISGGASFTTAGPISLPWAPIWGDANAANPQARFSLTELATVFDGDGKFLTAAQTKAVAGEMLAGLRQARSGKTGLATIAYLVQDEAGVDLADKTLTTDRVRVGGATATLLVSAEAMMLLDAVSRSPNVSKLRAPNAALAVPGFPNDCEPDALGNWILWTASKIGGEHVVPIFGKGWSAIGHTLYSAAAYSSVGQYVNFTALRDALPGLKAIASVLAAGLTALTTILAIHSATAQAQLGDKPFYRTKSTTYPGKQTDIKIHIFYDLKSLPDYQQLGLNCVLAMLAALGNNSVVSAGGLGNVRVDVLGEQGFGQGTVDTGSFVDFPTSVLHADTDKSGDVSFPVEGKAQKYSVPDTARQQPRTFTVKISSRLDETNINSAGRTFVDSLLCSVGAAGGDGLGCLDPISDIVKQFSFDLGDYPFTIVDFSHDFKFKMTLPRTQNPVSQYDSYTITAELQGCLLTASNEWVYSGRGTIVNHSTLDGDDDPDVRYLLDLVGDQDPGKTLKIAFALGPTPEVEAGYQKDVPGGFPEDIFTITDATGAPQATLTLYNALQDKLGDYRMTITPETPKCF